MENKSFVELLENAFDAGRRHDRNELRELKEKAKAAGAGIMIKTTTPPSSDVYSFRELSRILDSLSVVDHMIDSQAQRWAVEQQAAAILGQLSDEARDLAVGKTMFYAFYDDEEPAGSRWKADGMYITDVSYQGRFKAGKGNVWISMRDLDADRVFWRQNICEEYCRAKNEKDVGHS